MADGTAELEKFKLYHYNPNLAANVVFVALFATATIGHVIILTRKKTWYFIPFVIGCTFEAIGYIGRVMAAKQAPDFTLSPYIMQSLLILLGPALLAASIYMVLGRLIRMLDAGKYGLIRTNWMTKVFVTGDVLSFLGQGAGGGLMATAKSADSQKTAQYAILGGLGIQIIFFGFFVITTIVFHVRITKNPTPRSYSVTGPWRRQIMALYASSVLILVRSAFRMIEFGGGNDGVLMQNEVYLLALDGALMILVAIIFLWSHPGNAISNYKLVPGAVESGRETAEGIPMFAVDPQSPSTSTKARKYDSEGLAVPGQPRYDTSYASPSGPKRYSTSRER